MVDLKYKRIVEDARPPEQSHVGDLFDVFSSETKIIGIKPEIVGTGLIFDIPEGYGLRLYARSSLSYKKGLLLTNSVGIIDTNYKDEVKLLLSSILLIGQSNDFNVKVEIEKGERIGQIEIVKLIDTRLVEVDEIDKTNDRKGGFGSTD
ncbi:MAG: hypothetical protein LBC92_02050 [Rickettsiales bacterium]|jgi:dUTP pyrophosphatase|nr:hypothetical protein [Rickettsiales bacterium]